MSDLWSEGLRDLMSEEDGRQAHQTGHSSCQAEWDFGAKAPRVLTGSISEQNIKTWILPKEREAMHPGGSGAGAVPKPRLRILFLGHSSTLEVPISSPTQTALRQFWGVPDAFLLAYVQELATAMSFTPRLHSGPCVEDQGILIRTEAHWPWSCSMAIIENRDTQTTNAVCIGLEEVEQQKLINRLQTYSKLIGYPVLLPILLTELASISIRHWHRQHDEDLGEIHLAIKSDHYLSSHFLNLPPDETIDSLGNNMKKLTGLLGSAAGVTSFLTTQLRISEFLLGRLERTQSIISNSDVGLKDIRERVMFTRNSLLSSAQQNNYNKEAVQAQIQTIYNLIAMRNNEANMQIAQLARQDNQLNLRLSELGVDEAHRSRLIARSTQQDSQDMRAITVMTFVLLPATFTATFFGSAFWQFPRPTSEAVASSWVWLYAVVTITLMAFGFMGWRITLNMTSKNREDEPESGRERERVNL